MGLDAGGVLFINVVRGWGPGAILIIVGPWCSVSVTWLVYGGCWVLTRWVSPFWGLPASLCTLLDHFHSLPSHLNGEEGGLGGHVCAFCVLCLSSLPGGAHFRRGLLSFFPRK